MLARLQMTVAGQTFVRRYAGSEYNGTDNPPPVAPNLETTIDWNGLDADGDPVPIAKAHLTLFYYYAGVYGVSDPLATFAAYDKAGASVFPARIGTGAEPATGFAVEADRVIGTVGRAQTGLGGWDLDVHHVYDALSGNVLLGDGTVRGKSDVPSGRLRTVVPFASGGGPGGSGSGDFDVLADGSVVYAGELNDRRIYQAAGGDVDPDRGLGLRRPLPADPVRRQPRHGELPRAHPGRRRAAGRQRARGPRAVLRLREPGRAHLRDHRRRPAREGRRRRDQRLPLRQRLPRRRGPRGRRADRPARPPRAGGRRLALLRRGRGADQRAARPDPQDRHGGRDLDGGGRREQPRRSHRGPAGGRLLRRERDGAGGAPERRAAAGRRQQGDPRDRHRRRGPAVGGQVEQRQPGPVRVRRGPRGRAVPGPARPRRRSRGRGLRARAPPERVRPRPHPPGRDRRAGDGLRRGQLHGVRNAQRGRLRRGGGPLRAARRRCPQRGRRRTPVRRRPAGHPPHRGDPPGRDVRRDRRRGRGRERGLDLRRERPAPAHPRRPAGVPAVRVRLRRRRPARARAGRRRPRHLRRPRRRGRPAGHHRAGRAPDDARGERERQARVRHEPARPGAHVLLRRGRPPQSPGPPDGAALDVRLRARRRQPDAGERGGRPDAHA